MVARVLGCHRQTNLNNLNRKGVVVIDDLKWILCSKNIAVFRLKNITFDYPLINQLAWTWRQ